MGFLSWFAACLAATSIAAGSAAAQIDPMTSVAGGANVLGQGLGEAAIAGPSVFVTATGHAPIGQVLVGGFSLTVSRRNASAVAAVRERDRAVETIVNEARRRGLQTSLGKSNLSRPVAGLAHSVAGAMPPLMTAPSPSVVRPAPVSPEYVATTVVEVRGGDTARQAELLDALQAAGVDAEIPIGPVVTPFDFTGLSSTGAPAVDPAVLDRAADEAVAEARRQAARLASDAGRSLGEARQIILLARTASGSEASVTVAVRFALAPQR
ncbi:MAG TPA: SIMPL domain-containing protein [Caulobacteraceae bacterium]|jgi:uncharacterized protein YggE